MVGKITFRIFAPLVVALMLAGCTGSAEPVGAAVDNDHNVLTGGPITGVTLQDLPPVVKQTLKERVPHSKVAIIDRTTRNGEVVYEFTFTKASDTPNLYLSEDGKVLPTPAKVDR